MYLMYDSAADYHRNLATISLQGTSPDMFER